MSGGWDLAMDSMTDLIHAFGTPEMEKYMRGFATAISQRTMNLETGEYETNPDVAIEESRKLVAGSMLTVREGDPCWVSADVLELVDVASETFQPEAVYLDDLFIPKAFVLFERPVVQIDNKGKDFAYRAISWHVADEDDRGFMFCQWSHMDDPDSYMGQDHMLPRMGGSELHISHAGYIKFGDKRPLQDQATSNFMAKTQVLWRLAKQEIAMPGKERVARPTWRRAASWKQIKMVTVLKLRRARGSKYEGDEREVEWSHRWMVSGHWRKQWYPSIKDHRQIWIMPYVKGPDDRPLVVKRRAVEFVR